MVQNFQTLLKEVGPGHMSNTAYDTAWLARLGEIEPEISNRALGWLAENQLSDGSWGTEDIRYYHDRVISTLAAMIVLTRRGRRANDRTQIDRGLMALEQITSNATQGLASDPNGATVGFEMIAATLVAEAEKLGIIKQQGDRILGRLNGLRKAKMAKLSGLKISRQITVAFSAEMAGVDGRDMFDRDNLQEDNGSIANSPSATAYYLLHLSPNNDKALAYIRKWASASGGAPDVAPFDIFEPAWVLWNLHLTGQNDIETIKTCLPHLDFLEATWQPGTGIGHASEYTPKDGDDTGLVFEILSKFGRKVDLEAVLKYEENTYFRCFALEADPSISANIHILGALKSAGIEVANPRVQKILNFLESTQVANAFWMDKWHASPYYATSHALIICADYKAPFLKSAVEWVLRTQNKDGSWGYYEVPTAEETAYSLQALAIWLRYNGGSEMRYAIRRAQAWLKSHSSYTKVPLWIGKALYCPEKVVESAVLSSLILAEQSL